MIVPYNEATALAYETAVNIAVRILKSKAAEQIEERKVKEGVKSPLTRLLN